MLAAFDTEDPGQWVWRGLTDPQPHVRLAVVRKLGDLDPGQHRDIYETARHDPHADVARIAQEAAAGQGFARMGW